MTVLRITGARPKQAAPRSHQEEPDFAIDEPTERVEVVLGPDLERVVDRCIEALEAHPIYQRQGALVDVVRDAVFRDGITRPEGTPRIRLLPQARLREMMSIAVSFKRRRQTEDGSKLTSAAPPPDVVAAVAARGEWANIRRLSGIVEWPVLRPDGSVLLAPGYDPATACIYEPSALVEVTEHPTREDARAAVAELLELVGDFPFGTDAHRAAWLAGVLTLLARPAIDGPVPLLLIDANERGAGKSLLADVIGAIVRGQPLPRRTAPDDPAEWRKVVLAIAIAGDAAVLIDNVTRTLKSEALDAVLTGTAFRERLLGKNEELSLDVRTMFIVTANNAALSADLVRRSLQVRLEAQVENPEQRDGWRHPRLIEHVRTHRAAYLAAGLTILRAYVAAGRPEVRMRPMGSFEAWSAIVRAPLIWAGQSDPAETQDALRDGADPERESLEALFGAWHSVYGDRAVTVRRVLSDLSDPEQDPREQALRDAVCAFCDCELQKLPSPKKLGNRLRAVRGRVMRGIRLDRSQEYTADGAAWRAHQLRPVSPVSPVSGSDPSRARAREWVEPETHSGDTADSADRSSEWVWAEEGRS